jgi:membrane-associated phospholipid phosphatase
MAWTLGILLPVELVLAMTVHLGGLVKLLNVWPGLLMLIAAAGYCRWRPLPKLSDFSELAIWSVLTTNVLSLLIQLAGRSNSPLQDQALAAIDARMHFNTAYFVHAVAKIPLLHLSTAIVYASLPVLIIGAILLPPFYGNVTASRRYVLYIIFSAIVTAALFALWPAAGPWTTQDFHPSKDQAAVTAYLMLLKAHAPAVIDTENAGIVSFPSYHVVLAILSAFALSTIRSIRIPAWILVVLIGISTILTGWHYAIDIAGGIVVAIFTIFAVRQIKL